MSTSNDGEEIGLLRPPPWIYKGLLFFSVCLVGVTAILSLRTTNSVRDAILPVAQSRDVIEATQQINIDIGRADGALLSRLLGLTRDGNPDTLAHSDELVQKLANLRELVQDNAAQLAQVKVLESQAMSLVANWSQIDGAISAAGPEAGLALAAKQNSAPLMQKATATIGAIVEREAQLIRPRRALMQSTINQTKSIIIIANGLALVAAALGFLMLWRSRIAWEKQSAAELSAERAVQASDEKTRFLASMSHEIRTPMNAILGFSQLLGDMVDGEKERHYVRAIHSSSDTLLQLINDVLDLSKIEAGHIDIRPSATEIRDLINNVLTMFSQMASDKRIDLRADVSALVPATLLLDQARVRQVLSNLVSNAIKYTESGRIMVRARWQDGSAQRLAISVEDSGTGIAKADLDRIFEPFVRGREELAKRSEGAGLGLSITRRLVEAMSGDISVQSEVGRGSTFLLALPTRPILAPDSAEISIEIAVSQLPPMTMLVVDDVPLNRELLREMFEPGGHRVLLAGDGAEALAIASAEKPELILMDIRMPGMDGVTALNQLRGDPALADTKVIAVTASNLATQEEDLREIFDAYVRKPFARDELLREIVRVTGVSPLPPVATSVERPEVAAAESTPAPLANDQRAIAAKTQLARLGEDRWIELSASLAMRDVGVFAGEVIDLAGQAGAPALVAYGRRLRAAVELFDVLTSESMLSQYPQHLRDVGIMPADETS